MAGKGSCWPWGYAQAGWLVEGHSTGLSGCEQKPGIEYDGELSRSLRYGESELVLSACAVGGGSISSLS